MNDEEIDICHSEAMFENRLRNLGAHPSLARYEAEAMFNLAYWELFRKRAREIIVKMFGLPKGLV
jgi:hypothetical protein